MNQNILVPLEKILDSRDTTVGGGASSALVGAMAASMAGMVAGLSIKKPVNLTAEDYEKIVAECDELSEKLQQGAVDDMDAYGLIVDAFKLPKETDEEKAVRREAVQKAAIRAAEVPLMNARMNLRVQEIARMLKGNSNPACISDLMCAIYLSEAGLKDAVLNINANLGMIKDEEKNNELKEAMLELYEKAACL